MPLFVLSHSMRRAQVELYRRVSDCLGAYYMHNFIMDCLCRKSLPVDRETNCVSIHGELVQALGSDAAACSKVMLCLRASHWKALNEEEHSDPLQMLSTAQFSKLLIKPHSLQCANSENPLVFQLQRFGDAWLAPWDLLSSICRRFPTA
jgi:hypothetical protein